MKIRTLYFLIVVPFCISCAKKFHSKDPMLQHLPKEVPEMILEMYAESEERMVDTIYFESYHCILSSFLISKNEITNKQFCYFLNVDSIRSNGELIKSIIDISHADSKIYIKDGKYYPMKGYADYPVVLVSWWGAREYCTWLTAHVNQRQNKNDFYGVANYRLPTEFEWLVASSPNVAYRYSVERICDTISTDSDNVSARSRSVSLDTLNAGGVAGMNENAFEWTADDFYTVKHTMNIHGYSHYYGDDGITSHVLVRKHGFIGDNTCGRLARLRTGFYSDTGFRIVQTYLARTGGGFEF